MRMSVDLPTQGRELLRDKLPVRMSAAADTACQCDGAARRSRWCTLPGLEGHGFWSGLSMIRIRLRLNRDCESKTLSARAALAALLTNNNVAQTTTVTVTSSGRLGYTFVTQQNNAAFCCNSKMDITRFDGYITRYVK